MHLPVSVTHDSYYLSWQFVLCAGALALIEFCLAVALFKSYHEISDVKPHVIDVMKKPVPPPDKLSKLKPEEQHKFYRAMGWLNELGDFDAHLMREHSFSWSGQVEDMVKSSSNQNLQIIYNMLVGEPDANATDAVYQPICSKGRSSVRRRSLLDFSEASRGMFNSVLRDQMDDFSQDGKWQSLAKSFDNIWNQRNMTLNQKAYEIAINQRCLYTIGIRIMQELEQVSMSRLSGINACGLSATDGLVVQVTKEDVIIRHMNKLNQKNVAYQCVVLVFNVEYPKFDSYRN